MAVRSKLNLPFQEVLSFWGAIGTRDVTSHLGDEDARCPSTYREVFANPTMLAAWGALFADPAALSGRANHLPRLGEPHPGAVAAAEWHHRCVGAELCRYFRHPGGERRGERAEPAHAHRAAALCASRFGAVAQRVRI